MAIDTILQILQWAIPSGGVGAAIAWLANRKAMSAKTAKAVHDTYKTMYEDISNLLIENQKKNEQTISELQEELEKARTESGRIKRSLDRLSRSIEAIQLCPHRGSCPVSRELSNEKYSSKRKQDKRIIEHRKQTSANKSSGDGGTEDVSGDGSGGLDDVGDTDSKPP